MEWEEVCSLQSLSGFVFLSDLEKREFFQAPQGLTSAQLLLPWPEQRAALRGPICPRPRLWLAGSGWGWCLAGV